MTKIDIFSGFLGAGKTTLIKKLIKEAYAGEKLVLIENEFGEIGIDGGFLKDAGIEITEMNSGCICCSLVGNFSEALKKVLAEYAPDRIIIEPSGVGKLSDVIKAVQGIDDDNIILNSFTTVADATKCKMYIKNFGEFYNNQVEHANSVVLSRTGGMSEEKLAAAIALIREKNSKATIISTPWDKLSGKAILDAMEHRDTMQAALENIAEEHEHECECECEHHCDDEHKHEHDDHDEHEHENHGHDGHDEHGHGHEHAHDEHCSCGCSCHDHDHDHNHEHEHEHSHEHHHHHADEVFVSCGAETAAKYTTDEISEILASLADEEKYGLVLRAKGIIDCADGGEWIHFDYVPGESDVRRGAAGVIGRICIIGSALKEDAVKKLFKINS